MLILSNPISSNAASDLRPTSPGRGDHHPGAEALPELIEDSAAIATIAVFGLSSAIAVFIGVALVKRSFPERFGLYLSNDSSLRAMVRRSRLLLFTTILLLTDAINGMVYYISVWKHHTADFALHRFVFTFSFLPGCACATLAIIQRCAVVLMRDRAWRRRFVRSLGVVCFIACIILQGSATLLVWNLRNEKSPLVWYNERRTHIWALPAIALFPIITIVSALWSIKVYSEQSGSSSTGAPANATEGGGAIAGNTRTGKGDGGGLVGKKSKMWRRGSLATVHSISREDPQSTSMEPHASTSHASATSGISSSHSQPSYMVPRKSSKSTPVTRPLTIAFNVMTWCIVLEWIATMVISTFTSVGIVKSPAVLSLVGALGIVTESLFETVMQVVHQRVRRDPDDHCVQSNTEDGRSDTNSRPAVGQAGHVSIVEASSSVLGRTDSNATTAGVAGAAAASKVGEGVRQQIIPPRLLSRQ